MASGICWSTKHPKKVLCKQTNVGAKRHFSEIDGKYMAQNVLRASKDLEAA